MRPLLLLLIATATASADPKFEIDHGKLVVPSPVAFETNSAKLAPAADAALDHVKAYLAAKSDITLLRIENHADNTGNAAAAQALSDARALAVAKALVGRGVDCKRLVAVGFGGTKPVADNASPEGRAANRRTEFVNVALRGHVIGGLPEDGGGHLAGDPCK
jgi:OOP family OmpA-OmpF porin